MIDHHQRKNLEYSECLGSLITNNARRMREIKSMIAMGEAVFNKKSLFTVKLDLSLRNKVVKPYIWSIAVCGGDTWTLRKVDQKYLESFKIRWWGNIETISWTDRVRKAGVLHRVKEDRNILYTV
jgi:hypothetical protein